MIDKYYLIIDEHERVLCITDSWDRTYELLDNLNIRIISFSDPLLWVKSILELENYQKIILD